MNSKVIPKRLAPTLFLARILLLDPSIQPLEKNRVHSCYSNLVLVLQKGISMETLSAAGMIDRGCKS